MAASPQIIKKGRGWRRGLCRRVVKGKVDGPLGRRLWPPAGGGLCSLRSGGDSACGAEGGGLPSRAMLIESALRDLLPVSYSMISILVISRYAASPYPAAPDFHLKVKRLTMICASLALLQIMFAVHPRKSVSHDSQVALPLTNRVPLPPHPGDRINCSMLSCRDMSTWLSIHSPTTKWGEGGGASHQRGNGISSPVRAAVWFSPPKAV